MPYELAYAGYFVAWELFFRGFLLFGLYRRIGQFAIYVTAMPFMLLHLGKPEAEVFISLGAAAASSPTAAKPRQSADSTGRTRTDLPPG